MDSGSDGQRSLGAAAPFRTCRWSLGSGGGLRSDGRIWCRGALRERGRCLRGRLEPATGVAVPAVSGSHLGWSGWGVRHAAAQPIAALTSLPLAAVDADVAAAALD